MVTGQGSDNQLYDYIVKDGPVLHRCSLCGKSSSDRSNLRKHVDYIHFPGAFSYSCKYCSENYTTRNLLNLHISKFHRNLQQLVAGGDKQLYDYIVSHPEAGPKAFKCIICGKISDHKTNLRKHVENIHFPGTFTYQCKYCSEIFTTRNFLNMHVSKIHSRNVQQLNSAGCRWRQAAIRLYSQSPGSWAEGIQMHHLWKSQCSQN